MPPNPQDRRNPSPRSTPDPEEEGGGRMWERRRAPTSPNPAPSTSQIIPRSNQESTSNNNRKKKKPTANFAGIWTREDEIKILEGIIEHKKKNGGEIPKATPSIRTLLSAIAPSISFAATVRQLQDKIRHLKAGYDKASDSKKPQATGHKEIVYRLCDRIWPASPATKEEGEGHSFYDSDDYPELRIAVERRAGYLIFEEIVESLNKDEAESFNARFLKLREDEKELWKEIHERLL
ncbi:uncharacterized protein A4U43_C01F19450 [Asparagus officinalis]|uniref:Glabrous enhancer-binding protein-like DBD domain-containing protein n=1 Tax=Asparagus officinalis TaxID=4686 RepID=A0A5P1FR80_ASPOF|nr:probable transcription factor At1g61730 [Asparagus officinalis]ONK80582.1 uncharacterized protein A4U43_C01F19450 [Asparagus officinalis]